MREWHWMMSQSSSIPTLAFFENRPGPSNYDRNLTISFKRGNVEFFTLQPKHVFLKCSFESSQLRSVTNRQKCQICSNFDGDQRKCHLIHTSFSWKNGIPIIWPFHRPGSGNQISYLKESFPAQCNRIRSIESRIRQKDQNAEALDHTQQQIAFLDTELTQLNE
jgi:hypothetical protein